MNRVASKITQKICMFLEDENFHAGARQQIGAHHARGSAARNATTHVDFLYYGLVRHGQSCSLLVTQVYQAAKTRPRRLYFKSRVTSRLTVIYGDSSHKWNKIRRNPLSRSYEIVWNFAHPFVPNRDFLRRTVDLSIYGRPARS